MKIPLNVYVALQGHQLSVDHYVMQLSVPILETIIAAAEVAHPEDAPPEVVSLDEGLLRLLNVETTKKVVLLLYRFCRAEMREADGTAIQRSFSDTTNLFASQLTHSECEAVKAVLSPLMSAVPEVVSKSVVRID